MIQMDVIWTKVSAYYKISNGACSIAFNNEWLHLFRKGNCDETRSVMCTSDDTINWPMHVTQAVWKFGHIADINGHIADVNECM